MFDPGVAIDIERDRLEHSLIKLDLLDETEALKGAKQCLKAAIGWLDRAMNTPIKPESPNDRPSE
jgi:hypothetical protein